MAEATVFAKVVALIGLTWLVLVAVHESGHLIAGLTMGFRFVSLRLGPVMLRRPDELNASKSWRLIFVRRSPFGGGVMMRAASLKQERLLVRYVLFIAGGPLATLFVPVLLVLFAANRGTAFDAFAGLAICSSLFLGVGTLVPASLTYNDTDGMVLRKLLFHPREREALLAKLTFVERLKEFRTLFSVGQLDLAEEQLNQMEKVYRGPRDAILQDIVSHLRGHIISGESLETCTWSPGTGRIGQSN